MSLSIWEKNSFLNYDYIIIGSGILGLSVACEIKENDPGRSVLIIEKGILPSGASTKNAGFACFGSLTEILADFKKIGEDETIELVKNRYDGINMLRNRLGDEKTGFLNYGGYELINEDHLDSLERIDYVNDKLKFLFPDNTFEITNFMIGEFGFNEKEVRAMIYSRFESQIDTGLMMSSLIEYVISLGVKIINGCDVEMVNEKDNHVKIITNSYSGKERIYFNAKSVIVCANAFTGKFFPELNVKPGRGQVIVTKPIPELKFKGVFHFDEGFYYFRNFGDRVIFGGGRNMDFETEETSEFESNEIILKDLKDKLDNIILPFQKYEIDYSWSGIMGFNDSKRPEITTVSDRIVSAISCNGMGIALSSFMAKEVRKLVNP